MGIGEDTRKYKLFTPIAMLNKDVKQYSAYMRTKVKPDAEEIVTAAVNIAKRVDNEDKIEDTAGELASTNVKNEDNYVWDMQNIVTAVAIYEKDRDKLIRQNKSVKDFAKKTSTALSAFVGYGLEAFFDDLKEAEVAGHLTTKLNRFGRVIAGRRLKKELK